MPRIRDEILDCVIYLYRSVHEAEEGINIGGSGFLIRVACESLGPNDAHVYAITNRHVIDEGAIHVRMNTNDGRKLVMEAKKEQWLLSDDDDLAIVRLAPIVPEIRMLALPQDCLVTPDMVREHGIGI